MVNAYSDRPIFFRSTEAGYVSGKYISTRVPRHLVSQPSTIPSTIIYDGLHIEILLTDVAFLDL
jgi:hypothetical protein